MKGLMLALGFLVALCTLCAQAKLSVQPNFNPDKVSGTCICLAVTPEERSDTNTVVNSLFNFTPYRNLVGETTLPKNGSCEKETKIYNKTNTPVRYIIKDNGIETELTAIDKDLKFTVRKAYPVYGRAPSDSPLYLLGRTLIWPAKMYEELKEKAEALGMDAESVIILPKTDQCMT